MKEPFILDTKTGKLYRVVRSTIFNGLRLARVDQKNVRHFLSPRGGDFVFTEKGELKEFKRPEPLTPE